jgi:hypothetical protein
MPGPAWRGPAVSGLAWECRECGRELDQARFYRYGPRSGRAGRRGDRCRDCVAFAQHNYRRWIRGVPPVSWEDWLATRGGPPFHPGLGGSGKESLDEATKHDHAGGPHLPKGFPCPSLAFPCTRRVETGLGTYTFI